MSRGRKLLFIVLICGVVFSFYTGVVSAYDGQTTHAALTEEIINFYGDSITAEEKEWIVQGSIEEDTPPRWVNHFYDPINQVGWTGEKTGLSPETVQFLFALAVAPADPVSAVRWINDEIIQTEYGRYGGNETWKRGLKYFADGDKENAYISLGHVLHLLEDMAVPDHARNDTHIDLWGDITSMYGSPYEEYAAKWTRSTIGDLHIADNLHTENVAPPTKTSIEDYLISVARYSNRYFFSKDTVNDLKYTLPKVVRDDGNFGYGIDENGKEFPLVRVRTFFDEQGNKQTEYSLKDKNDVDILDAYFSRLARQAVLNGAGAIALFQKQAQDAIVNKEFQFQTTNEDVVKFFNSGFSLYGEWAKLTGAIGNFVGDAASVFNSLFQKSGAVVADSINAITGPREIVLSTSQVDRLAQVASREELAAALNQLAASLQGQLVVDTQAQIPDAPALSGGGSANSPQGGGGNSPQPQAAQQGGVTVVLAGAGESAQASSTDSPQADEPLASSTSPEQASSSQASSSESVSSSTTTASSTETDSTGDASETETSVLPADATSTLFVQRVDSATSQSSHYSNNWYQLGTGFAGVVHSLTFRGYTNTDPPDNPGFASHIWLDEFNNPDYSISSRHFVISDAAPFDNNTKEIKIDGLDITLLPDKYYRLGTYQNQQNRSVFFQGTNSTGTAMHDYFPCGEEHYAFYPYIVANKPVLNVLDLRQYRSDGISAMDEGEEIIDGMVMVVFGAAPQSSPAGKLQFEAEAFTTISRDWWFRNPVVTATSSFVAPGGTATIAIQLPQNGRYHWRARAVNKWGDASDWLEFGTPGNTDFTALHVLPIPPPSQTVFDASTNVPIPNLSGCENITGDGSTINNVRAKYKKTPGVAYGMRFLIALPLYPDDIDNCTGGDVLVSGAADVGGYDWYDANFTFASTTLELGKRYLYLFGCTNSGCYVGGSASDTYSGGSWVSGGSTPLTAGGGIEDAYFTSEDVLK